MDPQVVVGLLVDRNGFPLEIGCYEGNKAETTTIIPIVQQFQARHGLSDMVVVADAGMLSTANLTALDEAGLRFIVGSRAVKAPGDLPSHFRWHGDAFADGQVIAPPSTPCRAAPPPSLPSEPRAQLALRTIRPSVPNRSGTRPGTRGRGGRCGPTPASEPCATGRR
ncbi:hypothetical protein BJY20_001064 [Janibacter cremeus]|uniref:Transposase IS4-like domain-containing protein n=1 Tax=Janibacter cremeus TaxID=1285192 RepID=A0A852VKV8_9MICO|nr:hypothetical protein [Janibacter cremeus]